MSIIDLEQHGDVNYSQTSFKFFFVLTKQLDNSGPISLAGETSRYIKITFKQEITDWWLPFDQGRF